MNGKTKETGLEVAVIGIAARFPGAKDCREFWDNLKNGTESIGFLADQELNEAAAAGELLMDPRFVKARGGVLENREFFDASFFDYTPVEAEIMDPQFRVFHECTWHALEQAGYDPAAYHGLIGLYAGASANFDWQVRCLLSGKVGLLGRLAASNLVNRENLCTRTSHKLGLTGPAVLVQTACSTSLAAIHLACRALLTGECDMALAGGVEIPTGENNGYMYREGMIKSRDGHCRAFAAEAQGTVLGEGVGVVVLKRLKYAVADGDYIHAVIKGSALNNDGDRKIGFTAPSIEGQEWVIKRAHRTAQVDPASIQYIEAHGTGTPVGDPVEVEALTRAFAVNKKGFCALGSVKTNIGHLGAAAGVAGFIKTVLVLEHRLIPPSLHFEKPNPEIDFKNSPFYVNRELKEWRSDGSPLRAGVSSFGLGGTNAHVVLEEFPQANTVELSLRRPGGSFEKPPPCFPGPPQNFLLKHNSLKFGVPGEDGTLPDAGPSRKYRLILLSAKTRGSLDRMTLNLASHLEQDPQCNLADAAYTLQVGRAAFKHRKTVLCSGKAEAVELLSTTSPKSPTSVVTEKNRPVIFMFPGLGAQYVNMGLELYQTEPVFREEMDRCFKLLQPLLEYDIKAVLYPGESEKSDKSNPSDWSDSSSGSNIDQFEIAQVVIFIFEYALAKLLMKVGIEPQAMIGYSFGEYSAACLAGGYSLEDTLKLVVSRGRLIGKLPAGGMLSVPLPADELKSLLNQGHELSLAIDNGLSCVVAGPLESINALEKQLKQKKYLCVQLPNSHALHSQMMEPILEEFAKVLEELPGHKPRIPYISNVSGSWQTDAGALDPRYWVRHLRETVRFADGIKALVKKQGAVFIEVGPGHDLSALVGRYLEENPAQHAVNLIRPSQKNIPASYYLWNKIGQLWRYGIDIDWKEFYPEEKRQRVPLPVYPFERKPYWIDRPLPGNEAGMLLADSLAPGDFPGEDHLYLPTWDSSLPPCRKPAESFMHACCLVFLDSCGLGAGLAEQLGRLKQQVVTVRQGTGFVCADDKTYELNPGREKDYDDLLAELQRRETMPWTVVHLWSVTGVDRDEPWDSNLALLDRDLDLGFHSLLYLARALERQGFTKPLQILVVSDNMQQVVEEGIGNPAKSTLLGAVQVIPLEYPHLHCRSLDIVLPQPGSRPEQKLLDRLLDEIFSQSTDRVAVLRGDQRWLPSYKALRLDGIPEAASPFKPGGVYLIGGGLENPALDLALELTRHTKARLVLLESPVSNKRFCGGPGGSFFKKRPLVAEGKDNYLDADEIGRQEEKIAKELNLKGIAGYEGLEETANRLCSSYLYHYFKTAGVDTGKGNLYQIAALKNKLGILPQFEKFYHFFLNVLQEDRILSLDNDNLVFLSDPAEIGDPVRLKQKLEETYPQFKGLFELLHYCVASYPRVLSGKMEALDVIYPRGSSELLLALETNSLEYTNHSLYLALTREIVSGILAKNRGKKKLRILEIGAGEGRLTNVVVPALLHGEVEYYFTDKGKTFVLNAERKAAQAGWEFMRFGVLDISKDPEAQGYELNHFDMILGLSVVHAVGRIKEALGHLKKLLVPGGIMILLEETKSMRWIEMVAGLKEGWWYFEDENLRKYSPLLTFGRWEEVMKEAGFKSVLTYPRDREKQEQTDCGLIIARREFAKPAADEKQQLQNRKQKLQELKRQGAGLMIAYARRENPEEMRRAIVRVLERWGCIDGVIHFTGLDRERASVPLAAAVVSETGQRFRSWVHGLAVLDNVLRDLDLELDFCLLMSSLSSLCGAPGLAVYSAVHLYLDAFTRHLNQQGRLPWTCVNWDDGPLADTSSGSSSLLTPARRFRILRHFLSWGKASQGIHAVGSLRDRLEQWKKPPVPQPGATSHQQAKKVSGLLHQRPDLATAYEAPRDPGQQAIAEIWLKSFGFDRVGIDDDFFQLGGDSLMAAVIVSKIHETLQVEIPLKTFFHLATIAELAQYIAGAGKSIYQDIPPAEEKEYYVLSPAQRRMYALQMRDAESTRYNVPGAMVLQGELDKERLEKAVKKLVKQHESLRTSFKLIAGEPFQKIHRAKETEIQLHDGEAREEEAKALVSGFIKPFDLARAPLLAMGLVKLNPQKHILMINTHHIITDGVSTGIFARDLIALYQEEIPRHLKIQYKDYSQWRSKMAHRDEIKKQEAYWLTRFNGSLPLLNLPLDYPRPTSRSFAGKNTVFVIDRELSGKIKRTVSQSGSTLYILLLAVYNVLLSQYTGQEDIVIGSPITGRRHAGLENIIGMFVNMLALRNHPAGDKEFAQFLAEVKTNVLEAQENQDYQFDELVKRLGLQSSLNRNSLFDAVFNMINYDTVEKDRGTGNTGEKLSMAPYEFEDNTAKFDLIFRAQEQTGTIGILVEYSTELFKPATIEKFFHHYVEILEQVVENMHIKLDDIRISYDVVFGNIEHEEHDVEFNF